MIRNSRFAIPLVALSLTVATGAVNAAAPERVLCGGAQGKALAAWQKSIYAEAAKLCAKGDDDGVGPAESMTLPAAKITARFLVAASKARDKYRDCTFGLNASQSVVGNVFSEYDDLAWEDASDADSNDDAGYCPDDNVGGVGLPARNDCGAAQLKVSGKFHDGLIKEAARACAQGDPTTATPDPIDQEKVRTLVTKFANGTNNSIDKYGAANCATNDTPLTEADISTLTDFFSTSAEQIAAMLCAGT